MNERSKDKDACDKAHKEIVIFIKDNAQRDLLTIHTALVGHESGLGLSRKGLLNHVYDKLHRRLEGDSSYPMQDMAEALNAHFLAASFVQWTCKSCNTYPIDAFKT